MAGEFMEFGLTQQFKPKRDPETRRKINGVSIATVIDNVDCTGEARVQLMLPWLPGYTPWARLSMPMAGMARGTFFVPQTGDEVLVAFNHGDVREPYIIGTLWNTVDRPPALSPTDAINKRLIRTPLGHELEFDEATQTVTLKSNTQSVVTLNIKEATISTPTAKVKVTKDGNVEITALKRISLRAPIVEIKGEVSVSVEGGTTSMSADTDCEIQGAMVRIN